MATLADDPDSSEDEEAGPGLGRNRDESQISTAPTSEAANRSQVRKSADPAPKAPPVQPAQPVKRTLEKSWCSGNRAGTPPAAEDLPATPPPAAANRGTTPPSKRAKYFFKRCFDATFNPTKVPGFGVVLAPDSDEDGDGG